MERHTSTLMLMKNPGLLILFLILLAPYSGHGHHDPLELEEAVIRQRLEALPCLIEPRYVSAVKGYLKTYLVEQRDKAEKILGRALVYFPLFEEELRRAGLPEALKYLAVVESALVPTAISRSGAGGLWQFMPQTGASYDLLINAWVDERFDPVKATRAAAIHLRKQYERFGSWELALAAYNSGAGRVRRAVKRAHSTDFWRVRRYLPRETRNYVPAFIAATYLFHYYYLHRLEPQLPALDQQLTATIELHEPLTIEEICSVTGLLPWTVEALNPAWKKGVIAAHGRRAWLTLPAYAMPAIQDYLELRRADPAALSMLELPLMEAPANAWQQTTYVLGKGEDLRDVARKFHCHPLHLLFWNHIATLQPPAGSELLVWTPRRILRCKPGTSVEALPVVQPAVAISSIRTPRPHEKEPLDAWVWHRLQRNETLPEVARRYGIGLKQLYERNPVLRHAAPMPGMRLRIAPHNALPSARIGSR